MLTIENAKTLAVSFHAYREAVGDDDHTGVVCWGDILLTAQRDTGIELQAPDLVQSARKRARAALL